MNVLTFHCRMLLFLTLAY